MAVSHFCDAKSSRVGTKFDVWILFMQGDVRNLLCCEWAQTLEKHFQIRVNEIILSFQASTTLERSGLIDIDELYQQWGFRARNSPTQIARVVRTPGNEVCFS